MRDRDGTFRSNVSKLVSEKEFESLDSVKQL